MLTPTPLDKLIPFEELPDEATLRDRWCSGPDPVISIVCICFNHGHFIEHTLQGIFRQNLNYAFEVLCHDDASQDDTRSVLRRYAERYPTLLTLLLPESNQYSQGKRPFVDFVLSRCRGRYIARVEGDDYWRDQYKLQQQLDYLEQHPDVAVTTHDVGSADHVGNVLQASHLAGYYKTNFSAEELSQGWAGPTTQAMVFRNVLKTVPKEFFNSFHGDVFLACLLGAHGACHYLPNIHASMYRQHTGGKFSPLGNSERFDGHELTFYWLYRYYKRIGDTENAHAMRLKASEKGLRNVSVGDCLRLMRVRLFGANLKRLIGSRGTTHE